MTVSFLIPLYNCLPLTQAMLASLQATLPAGLEHEIIFVDDGSTDGTRDWLKTLEGKTPFRVVLNERNLGYAGANNRAAAIATGEFLFLLNNDLILTPRWLEPMFDALRTFAIVGNVQRTVATGAIDHTGVLINAKGKPAHDRAFTPFSGPHKETCAVTGACLAIRRSLWIELGGFNEAFRNGGEDVDLCLRVRRRGLKIGVALRSVIFHHVSASLGRKLRDEQNSHRLASLWRPELTALMTRAWCQEFFLRDLDAGVAFFRPLDSLQIAMHAAGLKRQPSAAIRRGAADAMDDEFSRWRALGVA